MRRPAVVAVLLIGLLLVGAVGLNQSNAVLADGGKVNPLTIDTDATPAATRVNPLLLTDVPSGSSERVNPLALEVTSAPTWTPTPRPTATFTPTATTTASSSTPEAWEGPFAALQALVNQLIAKVDELLSRDTATPTATVVPTTPMVPAMSGSAWTPAAKCEWLRANFAQTDVGVQEYVVALTGNTVPLHRVTIHKYQCGDGTEVFDGGIINGPVEGWNDPFTVNVPVGGVVDAYPGARFTGDHFPLSASTERAISGSVTALRATIWPWWDERPPMSQVTATPTVVSPSTTVTPTATLPTATATPFQLCVLGSQLAADRGWRLEGSQPESVTRYGGAVVQKGGPGNLPEAWEEICDPGGSGVCSIYPPNTQECRVEKLGVNQ